MISALTGIFLGVCAVTDLWKRQIWWPLAVIFMGMMMALHFIRGDANVGGCLAGICLGAGLWIVSWVTREAVGYGDGLIVAACGAALGLGKTLWILMLALCFSGAWSGILLAFRRARRGDCFPFVPFLLAAQLCVAVMERG